MMKNPRAARLRVGMSLVELLVVVAILVTLSTITLRTFTPSLKERQIREASRLVSTAIQSTRAKALQTGRKHGLVLERYTVKSETVSSGASVTMLPTVCRRLYTVADQAPYQGDFADSVAVYVYVQNTNSGAWEYRLLFLGSTPKKDSSGNLMTPQFDLGWQGACVNDFITIAGKRFQIANATPNDGSGAKRINQAPNANYWILNNVSTNYDPIPARPTMHPNGSFEGPYSLERPPVRVTGSEIELPEGAAIAMEASGWDDLSEVYNADGTQNGSTRSAFNVGFRGLGTATYTTSSGTEAYTDLPVVIWFGADGGPFEVWYGGWPGTSDALYSTYKRQGTSTIVTPLAISSGNVRSMKQALSIPVATTQTLFLLVSNFEQAQFLPFAAGTGVVQPWRDPANRWIALSPVTGKVQTYEVGMSVDANSTASPKPSLGYTKNMSDSRSIARGGRGISGS